MKNHIDQIDLFWSPALLRFFPAAALSLILAAPLQAADRQQLHGNVPQDIQRLHLHSLGALPANNLDLAIGLPGRDPDGLKTFLQQLYDPASPNFHHYLTPDQFASRFGATEQDYQAVMAFARANGLQVVQTYPNRMVLDVTGSPADIEKALQIKLNLYQHPTENRTFYAPDVEPSIPSGLHVLDITGLSNYRLPVHNFVKVPKDLSQNASPQSGSGPIGTYLGNDFRAAYVPNVNLTGTGQTVSLVEFDGYLASDISDYEAIANYPAVTLTNVLLDRFNGVPTGNGGEDEVSLDIEMVVAMAPGLSRIIVYEAGPNGNQNDILNRMASDDNAAQISCCWSWIGGPSATTDQIFQQLAAQGQTFYTASGDFDAFSTGQVDDTNLPYAPLSNPFITVVGGTTLTTTGPGGSWVSDVVWQLGGGAGSGGGISSYYSIPVWQQGVSMASNGGSTAFRNFPDVALNAENVFIIADNGIALDASGTSCATPLWAAFTALVNQKSASVGGSPMGFINPALYAIGKGPIYNVSFHDVTSGNNTNTANPNAFYAVPGYDLATGWGTPAGLALIDALVPEAVPEPILIPTTNTLTGGNGDGMMDPNDCKNLNILIANEGIAQATGVQGTLVSLTPGVFLGQPTASYPNIAPGTSAFSLAPFTVSTQPGFICGTPVNLELILKSDQTIQTNFIQLSSGALGTPVAFANSTPVAIPAGNLTGAFSPVTVSGIASIGKLTVSLYLTNQDDEFDTIQLISPTGASIILAEASGGTGSDFGTACSPSSARTTFDDAASESILSGAAPFAGSFAPLEPLSTFNLLGGTNANGIWQLNVINQLTGVASTLECWSLNITPELCAAGTGQCPGSDLSLTMTANPISAIVGGNIVYTLSVSNGGPSPALNAAVVQNLPAGIQYLQSTTSQGNFNASGSTLTFNLGTIQPLGTATITVDAFAVQPGFFTSTAAVGFPGTDPNPNNNNASASVLVTKPPADIAVSMSAYPLSVPQDGQVTYTINVTNNGPSAATDVVLTNFLPANSTVVSSSAASTTVIDLGPLAVGTGQTITLVLSPSAVGTCTLTSTAGLDSSQTDPVPGNNTASFTVGVVPAAYLGISAVVNPSPALSGGHVTYVVTVTNGGPSPATGVLMTQTIPVGATFNSTSSGNASVSGGILSWNIGSMPVGQSLNLTNVLTATNLLTGVLSNVMVSTLTVYGQPANAATNLDTLVLSTLVLRPVAIISPAGVNLDYQSLVPPNGAVNPGEYVGVKLYLQNLGNIPTTNLVATLLSTGGVTGPSAPVTYGALAPGGGVTNGQFYFTANSTNGGTVVATLSLYDGPANYLGTANFTFYMPVVSNYWNPGFISIPAPNLTNYPASGPASPYPSSNLVSGISSSVGNVTVTVSNLYHSYPHDIELLLVGPGGQSSILMSAAALNSSATTPVTFTFDQTASTPVYSNQALVAGSFQPAEYNTPFFSNSPPTPAGGFTADLSVFSGISPNGWWKLYAYDDSDGDFGAISNGWGLSVITITPVNQIASLGVGVAASPNPILVGGNVTFSISVTNTGTNAANIFLTNLLSAGLSFVSTNTPAPATQTNQTQFYNLGSLSPGSNVTLNIVATSTASGTLTDTVTLGTALTVLNPASLTATASTTANLPTASLFPGISATSGPNTLASGSLVSVSSNVIYTLVVTNNGPNVALNVTGVLVQGLPGSSSIPFTNNFGSINPGSSATATFTNAAGIPGQWTNIWTVSTYSSNSNAGDNAASLILTVIPAEPVMAANGVRLLSESFNPPNGAIDSNETVLVSFVLENIGAAASGNLTATLQTNPGVIPVGLQSANYGAIAPGSSGAQSFQFIGRGAPGATITAVLALHDSAFPSDTLLGAISNTFVIPANASFSNPAFISIPDFGAATPYPAQILVSGEPGVVSSVTATLQGFTHTWPHDVNVLLVSPGGQQSLLMAHDGGSFSVTNLVLTFQPNATTYLPATQMVSGTNLPTQNGTAVSFPEISGIPVNTNLNVFAGANPNGLWSLYVYDDTEGNAGSIANGWTLGLSLVTPVNGPSVLALGMAAAPNPVIVGNYLTYTLAVTNQGVAFAQNVVLTETLPAGAAQFHASVSQGTVDTSVPGILTFNLGALAGSGGTAFVTNTIEPAFTGMLLDTVLATNAATAAGVTASNLTTAIALQNFNLSAATLSSSLKLTLTTFAGQIGQNYVIQVSTNLVDWSNVSTNTAVGAGQFSITNSFTSGPARFYRAAHYPQ